MIKCIIIEDDLSNQIILQKKLEKYYPNLEVLTVIDNVDEAVAFLKKEKVDIVFSDMHIIGGTGLDVIKAVSKSLNFEVIYITAHTDMVIQAINTKASYYIVKPIKDKELIAAMDTVMNVITKRNGSSGIMIVTKSKQFKVQYNDIIALKSEGAYTRIYTEDKEIVSSKNLGKFESELPTDRFFRIHHSYIVNIEKISKLTSGRNGEVELVNGKTLSVAQRRAKDLRSLLKTI